MIFICTIWDDSTAWHVALGARRTAGDPIQRALDEDAPGMGDVDVVYQAERLAHVAIGDRPLAAKRVLR